MATPEANVPATKRLTHNVQNLRNRHILFLDIIALIFTPLVSLVLRLDGIHNVAPYAPDLLIYTLAALVVRLSVFRAFGLYNRYWKYASVDDLVQIVAGVATATLLMIGLFWIGITAHIFHPDIPRSLPFLDGLLVLLAAGGLRFSLRLGYQTFREVHGPDAKRVLVIGAGLAGQMIVKELQSKTDMEMKPVGFIDSDIHKQSLRIANLPVFGGDEDLAETLEAQNIEQVVIALPEAPGRTIRKLLQICESAGVPAKTIPSLSSLLDDTVTVNQLRNVDIEDLLRREAIQTDIAAVLALVRGKRVLITGAGGSIGSELCRQVLSCGPAEIGLLGHGENSIFEIHNELQRQVDRRKAAGATATVLHPFIADIRLPNRIRKVMCEFQPDIVFHAAAHKHVPLMELNPSEAISNNIFGTKNLLDAALEANVEHFVMISTDKVVNPTSVMGASKRVAEMLVLRAAHQSGRNYVAVRFGNVLGSRGSVVPTFKRQIASGGPVLVSHPEMKRYFMTIPEAVQLVLQSAVLGHGGEVFMLDMGDPVKIVDLAKDLIELSGLELGHDIDIEFTGVRPGEKLCEELFINGEQYQPTQHEKVRIVKNAGSFISAVLDDVVQELKKVVQDDNSAGTVTCLQALIPEFQPDERRWKTAEETVVVNAEPSPVNGNGNGSHHANGTNGTKGTNGKETKTQRSQPATANSPARNGSETV